MLEFFGMIADLWQSIIAVFDRYPIIFKIGNSNYSVSWFAIIFAFLVIGFVVSYFWKGAKT